jgi:hypothetical protein
MQTAKPSPGLLKGRVSSSFSKCGIIAQFVLSNALQLFKRI